jgi:hypothetical protein
VKNKLQQKLYAYYPGIFIRKDLSPQESTMYWGICCGDGWYELLNSLCEEIDCHIEQENFNRKRRYEKLKWWRKLFTKPQSAITFEARQVKEKFGSLRFYYDGGDDRIKGMVRMAESISNRICDVCGGAARPVYPTESWVAVRCPQHAHMHPVNESKNKKKGSVALDFDGVINSYKSGFVKVNVIPDPPVEGAFDFIHALLEEGIKVYIYSTRNEQETGREAIRTWMIEHGLPQETVDKLHIVSGKPIAKVYIDDRAWPFYGEFPDVKEVTNFVPWHGGKSSSQK